MLDKVKANNMNPEQMLPLKFEQIKMNEVLPSFNCMFPLITQIANSTRLNDQSEKSIVLRSNIIEKSRRRASQRNSISINSHQELPKLHMPLKIQDMNNQQERMRF